MRRLILVVAAMTVLLYVEAGKPHHPSPGRAERSRTARRTQLEPVVVYDTVYAGVADSVSVSGFEKAQTATRESMMISNNGSADLVAVGIDISYLDMQGRMLHKASHHVAEIIPAAETRMVNVPSFDRQNLFYYHLSPMSRRAAQATPFDVKVEVKYVCYPKLKL